GGRHRTELSAVPEGPRRWPRSSLLGKRRLRGSRVWTAPRLCWRARVATRLRPAHVSSHCAHCLTAPRSSRLCRTQTKREQGSGPRRLRQFGISHAFLREVGV